MPVLEKLKHVAAYPYNKLLDYADKVQRLATQAEHHKNRVKGYLGGRLTRKYKKSKRHRRRTNHRRTTHRRM